MYDRVKPEITLKQGEFYIMAKKFVFSKEKLSEKMSPEPVNELLYKMKLTPSQMMQFWSTEPSVERIFQVGEITKADPLSFIIEAPKKAPKSQ
jgi:hypothetical protein